MGRWSGYTFSQRHTDGQQAHENLLSITLMTREMQIKTIMRYHLTPFRMAVIKKTRSNKCWSAPWRCSGSASQCRRQFHTWSTWCMIPQGSHMAHDPTWVHAPHYWVCVLKTVSPWATTTEAQAPWSLSFATRDATAKRNLHTATREWPPLFAAKGKPTQHPRPGVAKISVKMWRKGNTVYCWWDVNYCNHYGKQYRGSSKNKNRATIWSSNSEYLSEENENTNLKRYIHFQVHCSIIYNSQNMETTCVHRCMNG